MNLNLMKLILLNRKKLLKNSKKLKKKSRKRGKNLCQKEKSNSINSLVIMMNWMQLIISIRIISWLIAMLMQWNGMKKINKFLLKNKLLKIRRNLKRNQMLMLRLQIKKVQFNSLNKRLMTKFLQQKIKKFHRYQLKLNKQQMNYLYWKIQKYQLCQLKNYHKFQHKMLK